MPFRRIAVITSLRIFGQAGFLRGLGDYSRHFGPWQMSRFHAKRDGSIPRAAFQNFDGVVSMSSTRTPQDPKGRVPVLYSDGYGDDPGRRIFGPDDQAIGRLAAEHLLSLGVDHFAYCGINEEWSQLRCQGFEAGLSPARALKLNRSEPVSFARIEAEPELIPRWLECLPRPLAILACNDAMARRVLEAAEQMGIRVPDELAVLGVDNMPTECEFHEIPISSIDTNRPAMGYQMARLLELLISGSDLPEEPVAVAPLGLVARQSTDRLHFDEPLVADAIRFLRRHACEGIDVEDAMAAVPISRRTLERQCRKYLHQSPGQVLREAKLQRARQLLLETDLDLVEISVACGFTSLSYMNKAFKKTFDLPPGTWRREHRPR